MPIDENKSAVEYEKLVAAYSQALIEKLRGHNVANSFLDYWVPDADPVFGIVGMADSARISGRSEIAILFSSSTVPENRLEELENSVGQFSKVSLEKNGEKYLLRAAGMAKEKESKDDHVPIGARAKKAPWSPNDAAPLNRIRAEGADRWDSSENPEFADVHPHFRAALSAALQEISHEGQTDDVPDEGLVQIQAQEQSANLVFYVDPATHTVCRARHSGAQKPSVRAVLELFCEAAENLPFQEVADHVGLKVLDRLVDEDKAPPAEGVLLPFNAGAPFELAPRLARQALQEYRASTAAGDEVNFYYDPPPQYWLSLSSTERSEKIGSGIRAFLQSEDLYPDDMELLRLEKNRYQFEVRGVVSFSDRIETVQKPALMRLLERRLRRDTGVEIELIADRAKDSSPLRRLS